jgi:hypothetical protein
MEPTTKRIDRPGRIVEQSDCREMKARIAPGPPNFVKESSLLNTPLKWELKRITFEYVGEEGARSIRAEVASLPTGKMIGARVAVVINPPDLFEMTLADIEKLACRLAEDYVMRGAVRIVKPEQDTP